MVKLASLFTARGVADVESVRQLPSLPGSAGELRSLARTLGAGDEALHLGTEATETRVKQAGLEDQGNRISNWLDNVASRSIQSDYRV